MDTQAESAGHLLGGRVRYAQPRHGFRSGIEPVLLAATLSVRPGERVLEGGSGAGATLLCLAARVPGVIGVGVERDPALAALAARNAEANQWPSLRFLAADIAAMPELGEFDHACANPPYHLATGTPSPDASRESAKRGTDATLTLWASALVRRLRPRGTLTFILPADVLPDAMLAFSNAGCRPTAMLPLWPKADTPAKLVIVRGVKGSRGPNRLLPGLVLHAPDGSFTPAAEAILRAAQKLPL